VGHVVNWENAREPATDTGLVGRLGVADTDPVSAAGGTPPAGEWDDVYNLTQK
jgi:hypothetical protein